MAVTDKNLIVIMYVPAISRRFVDFFNLYKGTHLYILGYGVLNMISKDVPYVGEYGRDLWSLRPVEAKTLIESLDIFTDVSILESVDQISNKDAHIVMPSDDITSTLKNGLMSGYSNIEIVKSKLRWDRMAAFSEDPPTYSYSISQDELNKALMYKTIKESDRSFDWWRQTSAAIIKDGKFIMGATNTEVPHLIFDIMGDSRAPFNAGENVDLVLTVHAERAVINNAARDGIQLNGSDMYVGVFPCRECAAAMVQTGIRRLFFATGSSRLDAAELLVASGVEIIKVEM